MDPYLKDLPGLDSIAGADAVILMTPHTRFKDLGEIVAAVSRDDSLFVDIWGFWDEMKYRSQNGYFLSGEVAKTKP